MLGANIGSTITAQIVSFQFESLALPFMAVGLAVQLIGRRRIVKNCGMILLGFGILFFGFILMKGAVAHWKDQGLIDLWFTKFARPGISSIVLGFLIGLVATGIVQSSGATIGILVALAAGGGISSFQMALPMILGCNVGTCVTALLASVNTSVAAVRAAFAHLFFNLILVVIVLPISPFVVKGTEWITGPDVARQIANGHTAIKGCWSFAFSSFCTSLCGFDKMAPAGKRRILCCSGIS
ncbi:MAG: Na/Pi symporter [Candidatus Theseobacter exili]|nr:Na/Pi symporter [Candidatus Theseobacter exili]